MKVQSSRTLWDSSLFLKLSLLLLPSSCLSAGRLLTRAGLTQPLWTSLSVFSISLLLATAQTYSLPAVSTDTQIPVKLSSNFPQRQFLNYVINQTKKCNFQSLNMCANIFSWQIWMKSTVEVSSRTCSNYHVTGRSAQPSLRP